MKLWGSACQLGHPLAVLCSCWECTLLPDLSGCDIWAEHHTELSKERTEVKNGKNCFKSNEVQRHLEDSAYRPLKGSAKVCSLPGLCVLAQPPAETRSDQQLSSPNWLCLIYLDGSINNAGTTGTLSVLWAHLSAREPLPYTVLQMLVHRQKAARKE